MALCMGLAALNGFCCEQLEEIFYFFLLFSNYSIPNEQRGVFIGLFAKEEVCMCMCICVCVCVCVCVREREREKKNR